MANKLPPIHPGEILLEEFLEPMGISQYRLAKDLSVPPRRINEIVLGKRAITPDTALRLSLVLATSLIRQFYGILCSYLVTYRAKTSTDRKQG